MQLNLLQTKAFSCNMEELSSPELGEKVILELDYSLNFDSNKDDVFMVLFRISIVDPREFKLNIDYGTWFKTSEKIDEKFKTSSFPYINAPAIAFPFLRSFISTLTLNAGYSPVMIPSVNFIELGETKMKE